MAFAFPRAQGARHSVHRTLLDLLAELVIPAQNLMFVHHPGLPCRSVIQMLVEVVKEGRERTEFVGCYLFTIRGKYLFVEEVARAVEFAVLQKRDGLLRVTINPSHDRLRPPILLVRPAAICQKFKQRQRLVRCGAQQIALAACVLVRVAPQNTSVGPSYRRGYAQDDAMLLAYT